MSQGTLELQTRAGIGSLSTPTTEKHHSTASSSCTLLDLLSNPIILDSTAPFLPLSNLLNLAATNRAFRQVISSNSGAYRYLDLSNVRSAQIHIDNIDNGGQVWRNVQLDEALTEDDFYSGPLRGIFSNLGRKNILQYVQTLVLDGLSVTAELCNDIINDSTYNVRTLSIRDVSNLNHGKLRGSLAYACRKTRPEGSPKLKALYVFGSKASVAPASAAEPVTIGNDWNQKSQRALCSSLEHEPEAWWSKKGRIITKHATQEWADCLIACQGIIAFDAVLCQGPRHLNSPAYGTLPAGVDNHPAVATFAVQPCNMCGKCPEGLPAVTQDRLGSLPLLAPPPVTSTTVKAATMPGPNFEAFVPRCIDCLQERYCTSCHKFWCESCHNMHSTSDSQEISVVINDDSASVTSDDFSPQLLVPKLKQPVMKSCWECGSNCDDCIDRTQRSCIKCQAGYCIIHNEGSCDDYCDWCIKSRRKLKILQAAGCMTPMQAQYMRRSQQVPMHVVLARARETM